LALAERIVQGVVDLADRQSQPCNSVPIDDEVGFQPLVQLIAVDVGEIRIALQLRR
jgi:hypothetical protein